MKKFYACFTETNHKDEIIVYAKDKKEAEELVDNYSSKIDWDYGEEKVDVFDWPPREKFDKDNTLIIRRNKIIEPKSKPLMTSSGELFKELWPEWRDSEIVIIDDEDMGKLRKRIIEVIEKQLIDSRKKDLKNRLKGLER